MIFENGGLCFLEEAGAGVRSRSQELQAGGRKKNHWSFEI
jgi:hypothetical protein